MESDPIPMDIDIVSMEKGNVTVPINNRMEFGLQLANHIILKQINNGCNSNVVISPLSLHAMLNLITSGCEGGTLEQLLSFLESDSVGQLNVQSSQIMELATSDQECLVSDNDLKSQSSEIKNNLSPDLDSNLLFFNEFGRSCPNIGQSQPFGFYGHQVFGNPSVENFCSYVNGNEGHFCTSFNSPPFSATNKNGDRGPIISFVNGIWVDYSFKLKPSFKQLAEGLYRAKVGSVDFLNQREKVRQEVNSWAKKETKGLIDDFLPPDFFRKDTVIALANALYFKGTWLHRFDPRRTRDEDFHLLDGRTIKAPFMICDTSIRQFYGSFEGFKVLKMPYKKGKDNKKYSMLIFLPDKTDGLKELVQKFNFESSLLHGNWDLNEVELSKLWIPKLKFEYDLDLVIAMKELGLNMIFEREEITGIVESFKGYVTEAAHKAYIEVNEEGTVAAAVTLMSMVQCALWPPPPSFIADHPFMFMIKEEVSGIVLFAGAVLNPLS